MTLFARRIIQKIIKENSTFLTALQIENHVKRLNNATDLSTEWEVVVLNVFSKFGTVIHEPRDLGSTHPDLLFYPFDARYCLLADITNVSDEGLDKRNPSFELMKELFRLRKQYKLPGVLSYDIASKEERNSVLLLDNYQEVLRSQFIPFIKNEILPDINKHHKFIVNEKDCKFVISYNPGEKFTSGHYSSYKSARQMKNNPIYNALDKKSNQLRNVQVNGFKGVILCDGSCYLLEQDTSDWKSKTYVQIINHYLMQSHTLDFIIVVRPSNVQKHKIECISFCKCQSDFNTFMTINENLEKHMPLLLNSPRNAKYCLKGSLIDYRRDSFWGGCRMTANTITISLRVLQSLLSGQLSYDNFKKAFGEEIHNSFMKNLCNGKTITNITIQHEPNQDDDWVTFEFARDPAISKYTNDSNE